MQQPEKINRMTSYKEELVNRYWTYQRIFFPQVENYFERAFAPDGRPPVFLKHKAWNNVIVNSDATQEEISQLFNLLPKAERHKWFRSMNSSQSLAQSVLGNLAVHDYLNCLTELDDDSGEPLLGEAQVSLENFAMEYKVNYLGERRCTSLDGFVSGKYLLAYSNS